MKNFSEMEQALLRSGKADRVRAIADSPDGQRLLERLDSSRIERAVQSGDSEALRSLLVEVLGTGEGQRLAKQLRDAMGNP